MIELIRAPYSYFLFDTGGFACFALILKGIGPFGGDMLPFRWAPACLLFDV
jgi:hypothetical protein